MGKHIIENGIKYELRGEQYYPIFSETNTTEDEQHQGKRGRNNFKENNLFRQLVGILFSILGWSDTDYAEECF